MSIFRKKTEDKTKPAATLKDKAAQPAPAKPEVKSMKDLYSATDTVKAKDSKKVGAVAATGRAYKILVKPLVTEKVSNLGALNKYVFAVAKTANKIEVARAIKEVYGIKPTSVNIINKIGKKARYGRVSGRRKDWKKAIITLPQGQTIKIYEGV